MKTALLTMAALVCFAANSLLCRMALKPGLIDAATFTGVRLLSGALMLTLILLPRGDMKLKKADWRSALSLFVYAGSFSFAYLQLTAGTGALLLFGSVQATMIGWGLWTGERPGAREWMGLILALGGLGILTFPGLAAPEPLSACLMALAGLAWGIYSLRGRGASFPLSLNQSNFIWSLPFTVILFLLFFSQSHANPAGLGLAVSSGALASGVGYSFWYAALPRLTATNAAVVQLMAPVLAALGGGVFLSEPIGWRLMAAGAAIFFGVLLVVTHKKT